MKAIEKSKRTVSSEVMNLVLKFAPRDGFKLSDYLLNKDYFVTGINEYDAGKTKSFAVTLESEQGDVIVLTASALKRSRVLNKGGVSPSTLYGNNKNILTRSNAEELWSGSQFFHAAYKMHKSEDWVMPEKLKLRYAVLFEEKETGAPLLSPYMYEGYSRLVREYAKKDQYPTMDDFRMELKKDINAGRLSFLPASMQEPTPYSWVKGDVSDFRHVLVFERA